MFRQGMGLLSLERKKICRYNDPLELTINLKQIKKFDI